MADLSFDDRAFRAGLARAVQEMRGGDGDEYLQKLAEAVLEYAAAKAPRGATGGIVAGLGMEMGGDANGPWVDVGVIAPPPQREDFYQEYGTVFVGAQPFMRPALAAVAGGISLGGGRARRRSTAASRGASKRAGLRRTIRSYRRRGGVTAGEARLTSRAVSVHYRTRGRRRR